MAYKVDRKKDFEKQELRHLYTQKNKKFSDYTREGTRQTFDVANKVREKGSFVEYNERVGKVKKVTDKGIHIEVLSKGFSGKGSTNVFVSNKEIEKGKVYPLTSGMYSSYFTFIPYKK